MNTSPKLARDVEVSVKSYTPKFKIHWPRIIAQLSFGAAVATIFIMISEWT